MKTIIITAIITIIIGVLLTFYCRYTNGNQWKLMVGILDLMLFIVLGIVSQVLLFWKKGVAYSQGLLIGMGVIILIGFSICSFG